MTRLVQVFDPPMCCSSGACGPTADKRLVQFSAALEWLRANAYLAAGADLAFVTAVASMEEVRFLVREIHGPLSIAAGMPYNIRTLSVQALKDAGVARVSLPAVAILSVVRAMTDAWRSIRDTEDFADILSKNHVCGMEDIAALLKRM